MYSKEELGSFLLRLMEIGAVKLDFEKGFAFKHHERLPDAPLSPSYVSLRVPENKGVLQPRDVWSIARFMYLHLRQRRIRFDGICGIPNAGEPFADAFEKLYRQWCGKEIGRVWLRKDTNAKGRKVGGVAHVRSVAPGQRVLLLDDLITKAHSKEEALASLREDGFVVEHCIVFLDREQGGDREMANLGVNLHAVTPLSQMLEAYVEHGKLTAEQYARILDYQARERALVL